MKFLSGHAHSRRAQYTLSKDISLLNNANDLAALESRVFLHRNCFVQIGIEGLAICRNGFYPFGIKNV